VAIRLPRLTWHRRLGPAGRDAKASRAAGPKPPLRPAAATTAGVVAPRAARGRPQAGWFQDGCFIIIRKINPLVQNRRFLTHPRPSQYGSARPRGGGMFELVFLDRGCRHDERRHGRKKGIRTASFSDEAALSAEASGVSATGLAQDRAGQPSETAPPDRQVPPPTVRRWARGLRLSSELVAGVLVGAVIGYMLDRWLGLSPWGFIVFVLLGFAAGILNLMRAAGVCGEFRRPAPRDGAHARRRR